MDGRTARFQAGPEGLTANVNAALTEVLAVPDVVDVTE